MTFADRSLWLRLCCATRFTSGRIRRLTAVRCTKTRKDADVGTRRAAGSFGSLCPFNEGDVMAWLAANDRRRFLESYRRAASAYIAADVDGNQEGKERAVRRLRRLDAYPKQSARPVRSALKEVI